MSQKFKDFKNKYLIYVNVLFILIGKTQLTIIIYKAYILSGLSNSLYTNLSQSKILI